MVITLISYEKNLGVLTLTDYLLEKLGKQSCAVYGWNYLNKNPKNIIDKINSAKTHKSVIIKYIVPRPKFSNDVFVIPKELQESDLILRVPTYREEIMQNTPLEIFKGEDNPMIEHIKKFY